MNSESQRQLLFKGVLDGVRVLDLSRVLAGPFSTQILADLGAEVIKIEHPLRGDDTRHWGPPYAPASASASDKGIAQTRGDAAYYFAANRGKQSLAIDLKRPEGVAIIKQLIAKCDILVENFKVGDLQRYGLDYAALSPQFPDLIYCSITGFGQTGPYAHDAGYDLMIQGLGGFMSVTGIADGKPGASPLKAGVPIADVQSGLYAAIAILAALRHRDQCRAAGVAGGQSIDISLLEVQIATLVNRATEYLISNQIPQRLGNSHPTIVPYREFKTSDSYLILAVGNDGQFAKFCEAAGCSSLATDLDYATNEARVINRAKLEPLVEAIIATKTTDYWLKQLEPRGVPVGPILNLEQVFAHEQVIDRGVQISLKRNDGDAHIYRGVRSPIRMSANSVTSLIAPPALGADSVAVLKSILAMEDAEIEQLIVDGIVGIHGDSRNTKENLP